MTVTCTECGEVRNVQCNSSFCGYWPATVEAMGVERELLLGVVKAALTFYDRADSPHMPGEVEILDGLSAAISKAKGWG